MLRRALRWLSVLTVMGAAACGGRSPAKTPSDVAFREGPASGDGEVVGRWLLAELVAPGGTAEGAKRARARLDKVGHAGMIGSLAVGVYDSAHGRPVPAMAAFFSALDATRGSRDPLAPLVGWVAANNLTSLAPSQPEALAALRPRIAQMTDAPGAMGWRARGELVELWAEAARRAGEAGVFEAEATKVGCAARVELAGPFGRQAPADKRRSFGAERPGPWPARWEPEPGDSQAARALTVDRQGCVVRVDEPVRPGIFYAQTFIDAPTERDVIVAAQGAVALWVDDRLVLTRDTRVWGVWPKFGARVRLGPGKHRVLARLTEPETSMRVLGIDGAPADAKGGAEPGTYTSLAPTVGPDPNALVRYVDEGRLRAPRDAVEAYLAAQAAAIEGQFDVASVLLEPTLEDRTRATALALATAASFAEKDPIFPEGDARDLARLLREQAMQRDPKLWLTRLWLVANASDKDAAALTRELSALVTEFPDVSEIGRALLALYGRLGWRAERASLAESLASRFSSDRGVLEASIAVEEETGRLAAADAHTERLRTLYPDSEIILDRALARHDYAAAIAELRRIAARRPERRELAERVYALLARGGGRVDPLPALERALKRNPRDASARLALADIHFARGEASALRTSLAAAIEQSAPTDELRGAIELVEGMTELEPYRIDGRAIARTFETSHAKSEGTAARVLDYAALWIHSDGSARMLEHELIRVQSQEAIGKLSEQPVPRGALVLRMRVLKKNGAVYEPERVEGKPTVTMPHLEVGDYIETENITSTPSDGEGGRRYLGPTWFFREADISYWRSEFVVVSPKERPLLIETTGQVPAPTVRDDNRLVVRTWHVDESPAAPVEPASAPVQEFLPSVRVGWGITLGDQLARMRDATTDELPRDPRLVRVAQRIVEGAPANDTYERARKLYRWLVSTVEEGREGDGRKVVIGKSGSRAAAFLYLSRALGLPVELGAVRDRLTPPDQGPLAAALAYNDIAIRLDRSKGCTSRDAAACGPLWFTVGDKFAPFGYLPAELRGQDAVRLAATLPHDTTSAGGAFDGIVYEGAGTLRADGSAELDLSQRFVGRLAIGARSQLEQLPEPQLRSIVETRLLARALPGARLLSLTLEDKDDIDRPLTFRMKIEVADLAHRRGERLVFKPPFMMTIGGVASLESRQTPMMLPEATHTEVRLTFALPAGAAAELPDGPREVRDGDRVLVIKDAFAAGSVTIDRTLDVPAGRVAVADYEAFRRFTSEVDEMSARAVTVLVR